MSDTYNIEELLKKSNWETKEEYEPYGGYYVHNWTSDAPPIEEATLELEQIKKKIEWSEIVQSNLAEKLAENTKLRAILDEMRDVLIMVENEYNDIFTRGIDDDQIKIIRAVLAKYPKGER